MSVGHIKRYFTKSKVFVKSFWGKNTCLTYLRLTHTKICFSHMFLKSFFSFCALRWSEFRETFRILITDDFVCSALTNMITGEHYICLTSCQKSSKTKKKSEKETKMMIYISTLCSTEKTVLFVPTTYFHWLTGSVNSLPSYLSMTYICVHFCLSEYYF